MRMSRIFDNTSSLKANIRRNISMSEPSSAVSYRLKKRSKIKSFSSRPRRARQRNRRSSNSRREEVKRCGMIRIIKPISYAMSFSHFAFGRAQNTASQIYRVFASKNGHIQPDQVQSYDFSGALWSIYSFLKSKTVTSYLEK